MHLWSQTPSQPLNGQNLLTKSCLDLLWERSRIYKPPSAVRSSVHMRGGGLYIMKPGSSYRVMSEAWPSDPLSYSLVGMGSSSKITAILAPFDLASFIGSLFLSDPSSSSLSSSFSCPSSLSIAVASASWLYMTLSVKVVGSRSSVLVNTMSITK